MDLLAKDPSKGIYKIFVGVLITFQGLLFTALNSAYFTWVNFGLMLIPIGFSLGWAALGVRALRRAKFKSDKKSRTHRYVVLATAVAGCVLLSIAVYGAVVIPYWSQFMLFVIAGYGILAIAVGTAGDLLRKQIIPEQTNAKFQQ